MIARRSFLTGLASSLVAAPSIVRAASLMSVRGIVMDVPEFSYSPHNFAYPLWEPSKFYPLFNDVWKIHGLMLIDSEKTFRDIESGNNPMWKFDYPDRWNPA